MGAKRRLTYSHENGDGGDEDDDVVLVEVRSKRARKAETTTGSSSSSRNSSEKRLRRFRPKPPQDFHVVYARATSQRFFVLGRARCGTRECPEEFVEMTGSTGNIYLVHIAQQPTCTCPHFGKGHQCKHILYVMSRVLRARFDLVYQLALLSTELCEIFRGAPPISAGQAAEGSESSDCAADGNRKAIDGDCPVCFMPFEKKEAIVYCRATCGQNIHRECFQQWAATKRQRSRDSVTCPMCRAPWEQDMGGGGDVRSRIKKPGRVTDEGYVNVGDQLGLAPFRDVSTYYTGPSRRNRGWW